MQRDSKRDRNLRSIGEGLVIDLWQMRQDREAIGLAHRELVEVHAAHGLLEGLEGHALRAHLPVPGGQAELRLVR